MFIWRQLILHRRKLWPVVWLLLILLFRFVLRLGWADAIIFSALPAGLHVILVYSLPREPSQPRRWYQLTMRQLCIAMGIGGPILAVVVRLPYAWVDWHHTRLYEHAHVDSYSRVVETAFYGLSGVNGYATAISVHFLRSRDQLTSRELGIEIGSLRALGASGKHLEVLLEIAADENESMAIRYQAIEALDDAFSGHPSTRTKLLNQVFAFAEDRSLSSERRGVALKLLQSLKSVDTASSGLLLSRLAVLATEDEDVAVRDVARTALERLPPDGNPPSDRRAIRVLAGLIKTAVEHDHSRVRQSARELIEPLRKRITSALAVKSVAQPWIDRLGTQSSLEEEAWLTGILLDELESVEAGERVLALVESQKNRGYDWRKTRLREVQNLVWKANRTGDFDEFIQSIKRLRELSRIDYDAQMMLVRLVNDQLGRHRLTPATKTRTLLKLLEVAAEFSDDQGITRRICEELEARDEPWCIHRLFGVATTGQSSYSRYEPAALAVRLAKKHHVADRQTRAAVATWLAHSQGTTIDTFVRSLAELGILDHELFVRIVAERNISESVASATRRTGEAAQQPPEILRTLLDDSDYRIRFYAKAVQRLTAQFDADVGTLRAYLRRHQERLDALARHPLQSITRPEHYQRCQRSIRNRQQTVADARRVLDALDSWRARPQPAGLSQASAADGKLQAWCDSLHTYAQLDERYLKPEYAQLAGPIAFFDATDGMPALQADIDQWWKLRRLLPLYRAAAGSSAQ